MTLRARLVLASVAAAIPVALALLWFDAATHHRAAERMLLEHAHRAMTEARGACEASPETFGGEVMRGRRRPPPSGGARGHDGPGGMGPPPGGPGFGPPPGGIEPGPPPPPGGGNGGGRGRPEPARVYAYDQGFHSPNAQSPAVPEALQRALRAGDTAVTPFAWGDNSVEVALRMPWREGPCAVVLARGSTSPEWGGVLPDSWVWVLPTTAVFGAMLLAMEPVLRRVRRLTGAVRRSASSAYSGAVVIEGDDEISELARAFDAAGGEIRRRLEENDRREQGLRHFLANTTHDVMIPLTVLQGHLTTLRERAARGEPVDEAVLVGAMDEAHYMASLVHNLSATARLETAEGAIVRVEVDLNALVARVVGRHRPIARELGITVESAAPGDEVLRVEADVTLLEQAVSNVAYNAVRYNKRGGHVAVVLDRLEGGRFSLRVIDDGPGIAEDELARMAERGARGAEARTRAPDGQGLGLHIARRSAALHGYELRLGPSEYGGLEVSLEGPLARGPARGGRRASMTR